MPARVVVDDDEQIIADLLKAHRRRRAAAISQAPIWLPSSGYDPDVFTITGSGDTTHALTYLPLGLNNVTLNGLGLSYGTDFDVDWDTGELTLLDAPTTDDVLEVWYVTTGELVAATLPPETDGTPLADTFDRAASSTTINPASDAGTWTVDAGTWGIDSATPAEGYMVSTTGGATVDGQYLIRRDFQAAAVDMQIDNYRVVGTTPHSRLWVAYDPASVSGYFLEFNGNTTANLVRYASGSGTSLGLSITTTTWFNNHWSTLRLAHDGAGVLDIYQDGVLLGSRTDGATPLTGTWVGISSPGTGRDFWQNFTAGAA